MMPKPLKEEKRHPESTSLSCLKMPYFPFQLRENEKSKARQFSTPCQKTWTSMEKKHQIMTWECAIVETPHCVQEKVALHAFTIFPDSSTNVTPKHC